MKILLKLGSAALVLGVMAPTLAYGYEISAKVNASTTLREKIEEKRENIKDKIASSTEHRKEEMTKRMDHLNDKFRQRISDFVGKIGSRFDAAIDRLTKISGRIDSRIKKLETEGKNESSAKSLLVAANLKIDTAKSSVANIKVVASSTVVTASTTLDIKTSFPGLKDAVKKAEDDIKAAHKALMDVVRALKTASSTESNH